MPPALNKTSGTVEPAINSHHHCDAGKVAFQDTWLLIGGSTVLHNDNL